MATNAGVTLDTIVIEIESTAEKANTNLTNLTKTLIDLKSALKGGFKNLNKLAQGLNELNASSVKINKTVKNLEGLKQITGVLSKLSNIPKPLLCPQKRSSQTSFSSVRTSTAERVRAEVPV